MTGRTFTVVELPPAELEKLNKIRARVDRIRKSYVPGCPEWQTIQNKFDKELIKFRGTLMKKGFPEWFIDQTIHQAEPSLLEIVKNKHAQRKMGLKFE